MLKIILLPKREEYSELMIDKLSGEIAVELKHKGIIKSIDEDESYPAVWAALIRFGELVKNSIDAGATHIQVTCYSDATHSIFEIKDNGTGFSDDFLGYADKISYSEILQAKYKIRSRKGPECLGGQGIGLAEKQLLLTRFRSDLILSNHSERIAEGAADNKAGGACLHFRSPKNYCISKDAAYGFLVRHAEKRKNEGRIGSPVGTLQRELALNESSLYKRRRCITDITDADTRTRDPGKELIACPAAAAAAKASSPRIKGDQLRFLKTPGDQRLPSACTAESKDTPEDLRAGMKRRSLVRS